MVTAVMAVTITVTVATITVAITAVVGASAVPCDVSNAATLEASGLSFQV